MIRLRLSDRPPTALSQPRGNRRRRGSAVVFMLLLMSVLATSIAVSLALTTGISTQMAGQTFKRQAAFYAAEAGIQQAIWNMNYNSSWLSTLPVTRTLPNGASYTVSVVTANPNWPSTPLEFQSVGTSPDGSAVSRASITLSCTVTIPGLAVGNNLADSGTLTIAGSVQAVGSVLRSGTMILSTVSGQAAAALQAMGTLTSSGTFTVPGNVQLNGAITSSGTVNAGGNAQSGGAVSHSGTWNVTGGTEAYDNPGLNVSVPTVDTASLISEAQTSGEVFTGGSHSNLTLDFTKTSGPDHVIYYSGNLTLSGTVTVIGSGTLVVGGTLSQSGTFGTATNPAPVSVVTTGNATLSNSLVINGALCIGGSLTKSGTTIVTGPVVIQTNLNGSGNVTINYAAAPSFIHYSGGGSGSGSGSGIVQSDFVGPLY